MSVLRVLGVVLTIERGTYEIQESGPDCTSKPLIEWPVGESEDNSHGRNMPT